MGATERLDIGGGYATVYRYRVARVRGRCLLIPPFGIPAAVMEPVAKALVADRFEVVVLDPRDHVGEGSGDISRFRLSAFAQDCRVAIARYRPTCVVAVSLGARAAIRALASGVDCPSAVLLTPVVDVHSTLRVVLDRDWFAVPTAEVPELVPVLDVDIRAQPFLRDCMDDDLVTVASTVRDLTRATARISLLPGNSDPWVDFTAVERVAAAADPSADRLAVKPIECDRHSFHEDPELALRLIGAMLEEVDVIQRDVGCAEQHLP